MKTVAFNTIEYNLVDDVNVQPNCFQATILKESYSIEDIVSDATSNEQITIKEDDEVIGVYPGYHTLIAASYYKNNEDDVISIELLNNDMQSQINTIAEQITSIGEVQEAHTNNIAELNAEVQDLTPYTETKTAYYGENEKIFYNAPMGNVSVFFDNYKGSYSVNRIENRLIVSFDTLEKETDVTISIQ